MALAATSVLYEGVPQFPDAGRPWRIAERLDVNIFHTSPTAIRMLRKAGGDAPKNYNYRYKAYDHRRRAHRAGSLEVVLRSRWQRQSRHRRHLVANGNRRLPCSTKPALDPMKPGSAGPAVLGIYPIIWDEEAKK